MNINASLLKPGDTLLYFKHDFFDRLVAIKTWEEVAHWEGYVGNGVSVSSRNGIGVNRYPLRLDGLAYVRRPIGHFNLEHAMGWFDMPYDRTTGTGVRGQKYDFLGLLCFTLAVRQGSPHRMFCSECGCRWYRSGGLDIVAPDYDADHVAPAQFLQSPALTTMWSAK